jgi:hypothetical protein
VITGSVGADGLELRVNPRIGPDLASRVPTHLLRWAADTMLGELALPLVVVVSGPYGDVSYRTRPTLPTALGQLYAGIGGLARWAVPDGGADRADASSEAAASRGSGGSEAGGGGGR